MEKIFTDSKWADLELVLDDDLNKVEIKVHKILMVYLIPFFEKLLTFGSDLSKHTIRVPNAFVASDLIRSFYGHTSNTGSYSKWLHALLMAKCRDYFNLSISMPEITEDIMEKDYDDFLELCGMVGIDDNLARTITKNLPIDYDLDKLSLEMMQKMIESDKFDVAIVQHRGNIEIHDVNTGSLIKNFRADTGKLVVSPDNNFIAVFLNSTCKLWCVFSGELYWEYDDVWPCVFSPDGKFLAVIVGGSEVKILDLKSKSLIDFSVGLNLYSIHFSPNNQYFVVYHIGGVISIYEKTYADIYTNGYNVEGLGDQISFTPESEYLITKDTASNNKIVVYDLETHLKIDLGKIYSDCNFIEMSYLHFSQISIINDKYLAICDYDKVAIFDIYSSKIVRKIDISAHTIKYNENGKLLLKTGIQRVIFSPDNKLIATISAKNIIIYKIVTGKPLYTFSSYNFVTFSPNGAYIALGHSKYVRVVDLSNGKTIFNHDDDIAGTPEDENFLEFSSDSKLFIYKTRRDQTMVFKMENGLQQCAINGSRYDSIKVFYNEKAQRLIHHTRKIE